MLITLPRPRRSALALFVAVTLLAACTPLAARDAAPQAAAAPAPAPAAAPAMLPARDLKCRIGHAANVDASRIQSIGETRFDSWHDFGLFLPAIPVRTSAPPDATQPAEPVDPATRVTYDPDGIDSDSRTPFVRVTDTWPQQTELIKLITPSKAKLYILNNVDEAAGTAQLFVTDAYDLATFDWTKIYLGECRFTTSPPPQR